MNRIRDVWRGMREGALAVPGLRVVLRAIRNYVLHQSANQAGSLAFSWLLAMFPLLVLASACAAYIGNPGDAAALAERVMGYAPQLVRDSMQPVIQQVLAQRNQALLAIGLLATLWTASSGVQAIRTPLNRAYGIERGSSFWKARLKVTVFTVVAGAGVLAAFSSVVFHAARVATAGGQRRLVHLPHRREAGASLRQLRRRRRHSGVPVHQRDDADLRRGDQWGAAEGRAAQASAWRSAEPNSHAIDRLRKAMARSAAPASAAALRQGARTIPGLSPSTPSTLSSVCTGQWHEGEPCTVMGLRPGRRRGAIAAAGRLRLHPAVRQFGRRIPRAFRAPRGACFAA
jgi:hypothetical protein